ncbi:MAG TPA: alpha/beta hydrolase [Peptococcaceae bacterium]|nr:alpha/beta hydrolase [Peptococcaceae bacterium]
MIQTTQIDGIDTHYIDAGQGDTLLLLHGWGASKEAFGPVIEGLRTKYRVIALDWPGFGKTREPDRPWTVDDYRAFLEKFIMTLDLQDLTALGHSFGGRVLIKWAAMHPPSLNKMILVDSAGIRAKRGVGWYVRVYSYKAGKLLLKIPVLGNRFGKAIKKLQSKAGSEDYRNASILMKQTMSKVINEDLMQFMPQIGVPTLLVWGDQDTATPLEDGRQMERLIPGAGLAVLKPAGHYSYLDQLPQFLRTVIYFMEH